jgi:hypothetical protein
MSIIQPYTKRRIVDIKESEDSIDLEYLNRLSRVHNKQDLVDLLIDYEEFLPAFLQKFRNADDDELNLLDNQIQGLFKKLRNHQPLPAIPNEAIMLFQPPLMTITRMFSKTQSAEQKRHITWGMAWLHLQRNGYIDKLVQRTEITVKEMIHIKAIDLLTPAL